MPQEKPIHNSLSKPVEPIFLAMLSDTVRDSFDYGIEKYGTELHSFNGRSEIQDIAEELVSALRYATQLGMRCKALTIIVQQYLSRHNNQSLDNPMLGKPCTCPVCKDAREALSQ